MRLCRFFCPSLEGTEAVLDAEQSRHLSKVLRLNVGDTAELFDGKGCLASAIIKQLGRDQAVLRLTQKQQTPPAPKGRVILAVSIAKGERFDWLIEKCTELGCDHIAAVRYHHTVKMGSDSTMERAAKIAVAALKQSGRVFMPVLSGPADFEPTLADLCRRYPQAALAYGDIEGRPLAAFSMPRPDVIVCIGPEGGFTPHERTALAARSAVAVRFSDAVLRIETAAVAVCAALRQTV